VSIVRGQRNSIMPEGAFGVSGLRLALLYVGLV
jgi:hypothetical protein